MKESAEYKYYLQLADQEYRKLYNIYNEIIENVNTLDSQTYKRMRKLSNVDKGLDDDKPIEQKTHKQTWKFTKSIKEFNSMIDGLLTRFKISQKETFLLFGKLSQFCVKKERNLDCVTELNKKLKLMKLVIQKFLNKILRLQSRSNVFPDLSSEFTSAKKTYEKNLRKVIIVLRASIAECTETEESMHSVTKNSI